MKLTKWTTTHKIGVFITIMVVVFLSLQFETAPSVNPVVSGRIKTPDSVTKIFERACFDCHSNETSLKWFDKVWPVAWIVVADIRKARSRLNFSEWDKLSAKEQQITLWKTVNAVISGKMPLPSYALLHPGARLSAPEIRILKQYLNSLPNNRIIDPQGLQTEVTNAKKELEHYRNRKEERDTNSVALNGVKYINGYRKWQVICSISRFDNSTLRIVYANSIAVAAIRNNRINPFPDGSILVKIVWNKIEEQNGTTRPGTFNAAQIMIKDRHRYPSTGGWGFAIFNGLRLEPTGKTILFQNDCFNCHQLQASDNGYVFNIPLTNLELKEKSQPNEK